MELLRRDEIEIQHRSDGRTVQEFLSHQFDSPVEDIALYLCDVPGGNFNSHYHTEATEVICFPDGGRVTVNGQEYSMTDWDMVLLEPGDTHGYSGNECGDILHLAVKLPNADDKVTVTDENDT